MNVRPENSAYRLIKKKYIMSFYIINIKDFFMVSPFGSFSSSPIFSPIPLAPSNNKNNNLSCVIEHSALLSKTEKKYYKQMIDCVEQFGRDNDPELFKAAGYCFDTNFGSHTRNMLTVSYYLNVMAEDQLNADLAKDRPGFFLITQSCQVYFFKNEGEKLFYYNSETDQFKDSSTFSTQDDDKLVVLNKTALIKPETFFSTPTPIKPINNKFYHEKQDLGKCGIHATHAFLGYPVINENQFSLLKLEEFTNQAIQSRTKQILLRHEKGMLPLSEQTAFYPDNIRFSLAQTESCRAESGNDAYEILNLLKSMASQGLIEKKYENLSIHTYFLGNLKEEVAKLEENLAQLEVKSPQLEIDDCLDSAFIGNESILQQLVKTIDEKLAPIQENINRWTKESEDKVKQDSKNGPYLSSETIALLNKLDPYQIILLTKNRISKTIEAVQFLKTQMENKDRLIIGSLREDHTYAFRKDEKGNWFLIDSLLSEQEPIGDPFQYLMKEVQKILMNHKNPHLDIISLD